MKYPNRFRVGISPISHKEGCRCFRCTKIPPNINGWSKEVRDKISKSLLGTKRREGKYKYREITYSGLHKLISRKIIKPILCPICQLPKKLELANLDHKYTKNIKKWTWLCHRCHMVIDGRTRVKGFSKKREYESLISGKIAP